MWYLRTLKGKIVTTSAKRKTIHVYSRNASCALNLIATFYYCHWVDTSAGGLLVLEGIIRPVVIINTLFRKLYS